MATNDVVAQQDPWRCTRCGACLAVCPVYRVLGRETESPRGRLALARAWSDGRLAPGIHAADLVYRCALCAACNTACPAGLQVDGILQSLRRRLAAERLLPQPLARLQAAVQAQHNILGEDQASRTLWQEGDGRAGPGRGADVVYFVGCVSALFPSGYALPQATVRLLEASDTPYTLLGEAASDLRAVGSLTGAADAWAGGAGELVGRVRAGGAHTVVTSCPSCYHAWRHHYARLVPDMGLEVFHTSELLLRAVQAGRLALAPVGDLAVTYHDPCDLGRRSGLYDAPRALLRAIPGLRLLEMRDRRENALCCGGGGNLESTAPGLVELASARRLAQALETGASALVTACPQCRRALTAAARRARARLRVWDLAEVVEKAVQR